MNTIRIKVLLCAVAFLSFTQQSYSQCCAVGGGSPLAGDVSQGVLKQNQFEISSNFQYVKTTKFLTGDQVSTNFLDQYSSQYLFTRLAYGFSERFTFSLESGYWLDKTQVGLQARDSYGSSGFGDLILFPRYNVVKGTTKNKFKELTIGLGYKIPIGKYNDSIGILEPFSGETFYSNKPPAVQASSGAQDILFTLLYSGGIPSSKLILSANVTYILKGWNPLGEKLGDYASFGLFLGRPFFDKMSTAIQLKGEWIGKMQINPDILMYTFHNFDPESTGSRKVFVGPQVSYLFKNRFTVFAQSEIPVYQYVNGTQIASQAQFTFGLTYRFMMKQSVAVLNPAVPVP